MLQMKYIADYIYTFPTVTDLCTVFAWYPKGKNISQDTFIYPVLVTDDTSLFTNRGQTQRQATVRINVVPKTVLLSWEYEEGLVYEVFDAINDAIVSKCPDGPRDYSGVSVLSVSSDDVWYNGYIQDRSIRSKQYTFIYSVSNG